MEVCLTVLKIIFCKLLYNCFFNANILNLNNSYQPVSRSVMANENRRILCGLFSIAGFLIIITANRKFSRIDKAAITPYITSLALAQVSAVDVDSPSFELFKICVLFIFNDLFKKFVKIFSECSELFALSRNATGGKN